jgi:hypothetical protein
MWGGLGLASIPNGPFNQLPNSCQAQLWALVIRARHNCGLGTIVGSGERLLPVGPMFVEQVSGA